MLAKIPTIILAAIAATLIGCLLVSCGYMLRSDNENAQRESLRANRRATAAMRAATAQTARGIDLAGGTLRVALSGRTLVQRYGRFPDDTPGDYITYRYFLEDGRFLVRDNWSHLSSEADLGDSWEVSGPRLCLRSYRWYGGLRCYRVARGARGELQFYLDRPGTNQDGLLEFVFDEVLLGPPPAGK